MHRRDSRGDTSRHRTRLSRRPGVAGDNGPAFSKRAVISAENTSHSNHLDARDHSPRPTLEVCPKGETGSHPTSPTNLGGVDGLTGSSRHRPRRCADGPLSADTHEPELRAEVRGNARANAMATRARRRSGSGTRVGYSSRPSRNTGIMRRSWDIKGVATSGGLDSDLHREEPLQHDVPTNDCSCTIGPI